jgi:hypothetical protein
VKLGADQPTTVTLPVEDSTPPHTPPAQGTLTTALQTNGYPGAAASVALSATAVVDVSPTSAPSTSPYIFRLGLLVSGAERVLSQVSRWVAWVEAAWLVSSRPWWVWQWRCGSSKERQTSKQSNKQSKQNKQTNKQLESRRKTGGS